LRKIILIVVLSLSLLVCSCNNNPRNFSVQLESVRNDSIQFSPSYEELYAQAFLPYFPEFYKKQLKEINLSSDSVIVSTVYTDAKNFYFQLYKRGLLDKTKLLERNVDTVKESLKGEQTQLFILSDFKGESRDVYIKTNRTNAYKFYHSFPKNFESLSEEDSNEIINSLPKLDFAYNEYINGKSRTFYRKIKLFPSLRNTNFVSMDHPISYKSRVTISFDDYWRGDFFYEDDNYDLAIQGLNSGFISILVKNDSLRFSKNNYTYNTNFKYSLTDTIALRDDLFVIDSLDIHNLKIEFKPIHYSKKYFSHRIGTNIKDFNVPALNGKEANLSTYIDKDYLIMYFWGTWCKPCISSFPELVKIQERNKNTTSILGVAYDTNTEDVSNFIQKHTIPWKNAYYNRNFRKGMIQDLKIMEYPTYLLIDKQLKILYRGSDQYELNKTLENLQK
jgi:thiol-disulfide isomerase/thioredoxin